VAVDLQKILAVPFLAPLLLTYSAARRASARNS